MDGAGGCGAAAGGLPARIEEDALSNLPDFKNPNREPVISVMGLASLDDTEMLEGYDDGNAGEPCGDN